MQLFSGKFNKVMFTQVIFFLDKDNSICTQNISVQKTDFQ